MPGGIKLCSPGTFGVVNYLIISNGSCQVNFMKPKRATIRYTNSQWLHEDGPEASVDGVDVQKTGQKPPSPRGHGSEVLVGMVAVPKSGRGPFRGRFERDCWIVRHARMPLRHLWAGWTCRRPVRSPSSPREDATEVLVGMVVVPKTGQKNASPRGDGFEMVVGGGSVPNTR